MGLEKDNRKDVLGNFSNCRMNVLINFKFLGGYVEKYNFLF